MSPASPRGRRPGHRQELALDGAVEQAVLIWARRTPSSRAAPRACCAETSQAGVSETPRKGSCPGARGREARITTRSACGRARAPSRVDVVGGEPLQLACTKPSCSCGCCRAFTSRRGGPCGRERSARARRGNSPRRVSLAAAVEIGDVDEVAASLAKPVVDAPARPSRRPSRVPTSSRRARARIRAGRYCQQSILH